jgi:hypothetical protein
MIRDLIEDAYRKLGVVAEDEAMTPDQAKTGLRELNRMVRSWQNDGFNLWTVETYSLTLTTAASYTLTVRPMRVNSARLKMSGIETPMQSMTRDEYDEIPDKASTGLPTSYHFSRRRDTAVVYVWPLLAAADGETVEITYQRELEENDDLSDDPDSPVEWGNAIVYNLAVQLADNHEKPAPTEMAAYYLGQALAADREGSVFFFGECD